MSFNWLLVRGAGADPGALKFSALMNKQSIAENEIFSPEKRDPDILASHTDDLVLVRDPFDFQKLNTVTNKFYGPMEPDGVNLSYWCRFNHIAGHMTDLSLSQNSTIPYGNPKLIRGPDDGVKGGVIMSAVNMLGSPVMDYYQVFDNDRMRVSSLTTGFSVYVAFAIENEYSGGAIVYTSRGIKPLGIKVPGIKVSTYAAGTPSGESATVAFKVDDSGATAGWWLKVGQSGELKFFVRRASVTYNFISAINKIKKGQLYEVCLTYTIAGNVLTMRINNEVQTDSANETPTFPTAHSNDLWICVGVNQNTELMEGIMKDLRFYRNFIFTSLQQDNIWANKRSISPIAFGQIAVAGHTFFNENIYGGGFDSTGFDSTGYDTT
jgi:hypothetical protein